MNKRQPYPHHEIDCEITIEEGAYRTCDMETNMRARYAPHTVKHRVESSTSIGFRLPRYEPLDTDSHMLLKIKTYRRLSRS